MQDKFVRPKLATGLPPASELTKEQLQELDREEREWRAAVDAHAAKVEAIDADDLRLRVR